MTGPTPLGSLVVGWAFVLLIFGAAVALIGEAVWCALKALRPRSSPADEKTMRCQHESFTVKPNAQHEPRAVCVMCGATLLALQDVADSVAAIEWPAEMRRKWNQ